MIDNTKHIFEIKKNILNIINNSFNNINIAMINHIVNNIVISLKKEGTIYIAGNGGSCADAEHFVAEMQGRLKIKNRQAYKFESLTSNSSTITALANDFGYEYSILFQLEGRFNKEKDILLCLSTSGNSKNIWKVAETIHSSGGFVISLTGNNRECQLNYCNNNILFVESNETERIQEVHKMYLHIIAELVEEEMENG